jgi:hypothetical protein
MIGAHSQVSIQPQQRSVLSKRHSVRTFYHLFPSARLIFTSSFEQNSRVKIQVLSSARCAMLSSTTGLDWYYRISRRLCHYLGIFEHQQIPVICTSHLPTFASKRSCAIINSPVTVRPIYKVGKPAPTIRMEYPVSSEGYILCENRPPVKVRSKF